MLMQQKRLLQGGQIAWRDASVQQFSQKQPFDADKMLTVRNGNSLHLFRTSHLWTKLRSMTAHLQFISRLSILPGFG